MTIQKTYPYILIVGSIVGLLASFLLTNTTIDLIRNPAAQVPCNLNPFISCTSAATAWQSEVFGFLNSLLGVTSFSMLFAMGLMLLLGGPDDSVLDKLSGQNRARKPLWLLVNLGTLAAFVFVLWFIYQSLYNIGSLCIYCMITWVVTWPIFLYTTIWNYRENNFSILGIHKSKFFDFLSKHHLPVLVAWYVIVVVLIIFQFRDFLLASL